MLTREQPSFRTDFNAVDDDEHVAAVPDLGGSGVMPAIGDVVRLFDGDDNACLGVVTAVETDFVMVRPDWETWTPGVRFSGVDLLEALRASVAAAQSESQTMGSRTRVFEFAE